MRLTDKGAGRKLWSSLWNIGRLSGTSETADPLEGAFLKVERAKVHIDELNAAIRGFFDRKPYRVVIKQGPNPQQHLWVVEIREPLPSNLAPIIGDAVHNMRSTLDLLACACVRANGKSLDGVYFPIAKSPKGVEASIKKAHIQRASKQVVEVFKTLEVYPGGKHEAISVVHALDRADKHRLLIPVVNLASFNEVLHIGGEIIYPGLENWLFRLEDGAEVFRTDKVVYSKQVDDEVNAAFHIVFGKDQPFYGKPVIPTLKSSMEIVEAIIKLFDGVI